LPLEPAVLQTQRDAVIELRPEEAINDEALCRIQRDIHHQ